MDRNELAARFAVAQYGDGREWIGTVSDVARHAVEMADALLAALTLTPTPVPPVDPVREAERAVVEAADAWTVAYDKNDYPDSGHSERIRLSDAIDALRAARKARGGAS